MSFLSHLDFSSLWGSFCRMYVIVFTCGEFLNDVGVDILTLCSDFRPCLDMVVRSSNITDTVVPFC